ncbi:hypothetical protein H8356DRAFT_1743331 [Neocallimastix lanati (nom. inval.)]|uniref:Radial spoke 3 n=1 Tax=Neocallimastix californiae TaxID=1754190 RepID=A0A1Y2BTU2_9FUNG|nr:hypothetical protein H8356DRAFT_1743331 [Neocallimastix sp. JGI-2020a]ORY37545.1 hypothetical protein LY90DRAFT_672812 [Neocallimastix californiae]|eukprot:ORY37545.1 hypothetical protein LY90DRAFT_672812 [Neocallimastix californiae]
MESENTKENEVSTTVTENIQNMNGFQQSENAEVQDETTNTVINEINKVTPGVRENTPDNKIINEVVSETKPIETENAPNEVRNSTNEEIASSIERLKEETIKIHENGINNENKVENEKSLIKEISITPPINNNKDNILEIHTDVAETVAATEESPITETTNIPVEQNIISKTYQEQNNTIQNKYNSSTKSTTNNQSISKPVDVENYKFSSEPKAIPAPSQRRKYRDPHELKKMTSIQKNEFNQDNHRIACNIMYDPRVVRGNTYAAKNIPLHSESDPLERHKQEEMKRRTKARKRAAEKRIIKTPEPVEGRRHVEIQTDLYLEELYDKVPEAIATTQTDLFLDRAPSPLYVPQKSGKDAATQIYDGELFNFNFEIEPILEVLVGKTLEQGLNEVMEEEELEMLRRHQAKFEERRDAELAEVQRLEDAERRRSEEKNRRITEKIKLMEEKKEVAEKIAAKSFTKAYLSNLIPSIFETLNDNGFFHDPRETEIENYFLPWLTHKSNNYIDKIKTSRLLLDHIILDSIKQLNDMGKPIFRGLKERKHKKQKKYISKEEWMDPDRIFKCVESKPSIY